MKTFLEILIYLNANRRKRMKIDSKDIINKQYILLDWNVIKYLKKPRDDADKDFLIILDRLRKRFEFPFVKHIYAT